MKKYLRRLLALAGITAVLALAGCGGGGEPSASATPAPTGSAEAGQSGNNPTTLLRRGKFTVIMFGTQRMRATRLKI